MSTVFRPDAYDILGQHTDRIRALEGGCPPFIVPDNPDFENGWTHAGPPYELWGYRVCDGQLEFKGHLLPGSSGTVAYTLPLSHCIFPGDPTWLTDIVSGGGFAIARVYVDMYTGEITITYPAS